MKVPKVQSRQPTQSKVSDVKRISGGYTGAPEPIEQDHSGRSPVRTLPLGNWRVKLNDWTIARELSLLPSTSHNPRTTDKQTRAPRPLPKTLLCVRRMTMSVETAREAVHGIWNKLRRSVLRIRSQITNERRDNGALSLSFSLSRPRRDFQERVRAARKRHGAGSRPAKRNRAWYALLLLLLLQSGGNGSTCRRSSALRNRFASASAARVFATLSYSCDYPVYNDEERERSWATDQST